MNKMFFNIVILLSIFLTTVNSYANEAIMGAGATFPYPLYSKMFNEYYKQTNQKINYQSIGSGGGQRQLKAKTVDFGATDAYVYDKDMPSFEKEILHIPITAGGVAITYNLPGIKDLKLNADVLAEIFLGKIKRWDDEKIQLLNPGKKLPKFNVVTIQRADSSGTTFIFTDYMNKASEIWKKEGSVGKSVKWPKGLAGKGNNGVASLIKIKGSIAYLGSVYALQNNMDIALIENKNKVFVKPSIASISEAANTKIPDDTRVNISNTEAKNGYPISGLTWIIVYKNQKYDSRKQKDSDEIKKLLNWMVTKGQSHCEELNYAPLSENVKKLAINIINEIHYK